MQSTNDAFSSSPFSETSAIGEDPIDVTTEPPSDSDSDDNTAMSMDMELTGQDITGQSMASVGFANEDTTSSSARLDDALQQAAAQAHTRGIDFDENGDMTMEMATQEITATFQPWIRTAKTFESRITRRTSAVMDQENQNPFSPAFKADVVSRLSQVAGNLRDDETQDLSMDITRVIGGIVGSQSKGEPENATVTPTQRGVKRRQSSANLIPTESAGSPSKRHTSRRTSVRLRRRSKVELTAAEDETMDFTTAIGGFQQTAAAELIELAIRRQSIDTSLGDDSMDLTMVMGRIESGEQPEVDASEDVDSDEDMSMELTTSLDKTILVNHSSIGALTSVQSPTPKSPKTPIKTPSPRKLVADQMTPTIIVTKSPTPQKSADVPAIQPRRSPRRSLAPVNTAAASPARAKPAELSTTESAAPPIQLPPPTELNFESVTQNEEPQILSTNTVKSDVQVDESIIDAASEHSDRGKPMKISDSIRLLSTPRKKAVLSPAKRIVEALNIFSTPKTSPKKMASPSKAQSPTKKSRTPIQKPQKMVRMDSAAASGDSEDHEEQNVLDTEEDGSRISLQEFLDLTNIRFMDLTTTKRRHTGYPGADRAQLADDEDDETEYEQPTMENNVAAALGVVPMLSMYTHVSFWGITGATLCLFTDISP